MVFPLGPVSSRIMKEMCGRGHHGLDRYAERSSDNMVMFVVLIDIFQESLYVIVAMWHCWEAGLVWLRRSQQLNVQPRWC